MCTPIFEIVSHLQSHSYSNTKLLPLTLSCLLLFAVPGFSQPVNSPTGCYDIEIRVGIDFREQQRDQQVEDSLHAVRKFRMKQQARSFWNGQCQTLNVMLMGNHEFRVALHVSDEQYRQYQNIMRDFIETSFRYFDKDDSFFLQSECYEHTEIEMKGTMIGITFFVNPFYAVANATLNDILTPQQKQMMLEAQLVAMDKMPIFSTDIFEALDLSSLQRQEVVRIKEELEPEFERHLEMFVRNRMVLDRKLDSEHAKGVRDSEGNRENTEDIKKRLMEEDQEFRKIQNEIQTHSKVFSTQFRTRMFNILTDEQLLRLQELIDNPPEHARVFVKMLRRDMGLNVIRR